ncbi:MAG: UbiA family prenyltransferase [Candidatus Bathyarchaeia archaeon]
MAVKLARPRTWAFIILAFLISWALTGSSFSIKFLIGMVIFVLWIASVNIINAYTDLEEDRINLPQRVKMIEQVGIEKLPYIVLGISIICLLLSLLIGVAFFVVCVIAVFDGLAYSLKPFRFKANPVLSLISFSGAVIFPLIGAWAITRDIFSIPLLFVVLGYFFLVYGTIKNLPDYDGDKEAGLKTTATVFSTRKKAVVVATVLLLSPYVLLGVFLSLNALDYKFLLLFTSFPFIALICYRAFTECKIESLEKLHTYGFFYEAMVLSLALFLVTSLLNAIIIVSITLLATWLIQQKRIDSR